MVSSPFTLSLLTLASLASASINGFTYLSCNSAYDFNPPSSFFLAANSTSMTIELCTSTCSTYNMAALYNTECFCSPTSPPSVSSSQDTECNTPCPGNPTEICGGYQNVAIGSEWRSVYSKTNSSSSVSGTATSTTTVFLSLNKGYTSTVYSTLVDTVISCGPEVENCPGRTSSTVVASSWVGNLTVAMASAVVKATSTIVQGNGNATVKATSLTSATGTSTPTIVTFTGAAASMGVEIFGFVVLFACALVSV